MYVWQNVCEATCHGGDLEKNAPRNKIDHGGGYPHDFSVHGGGYFPMALILGGGTPPPCENSPDEMK